MKYWITISSSAGTVYCDLEAATGFNFTNPLDRIGSGSFELPAQHPKRAHVIVNRIARCYTVVNSVVTEQGAIIIEKLETRVDGSGIPTLSVSGPSLMRELTYKSVRDLLIAKNLDTHRPDTMTMLRGDIYNPGSVITTELPEACDNNNATHAVVQLFGDDASSFIIMRHTQHNSRGDFIAAYFLLDAGHLNNNVVTMKYQYWDGNGWPDLVLVSDGTAVAGAPFAQSGWVIWETPTGQTAYTDAYGINYIIRLRAQDPASTDEFWIVDTSIRELIPTDTALADIMAFAPTWALDTTFGYATTLNDEVFNQFNGENVFEALERTAKITGEHFRESAGREVCWLQEALTASGVRAVGGTGDPADIDTISYLCQITNITETIESADLIKRIYPYGAGSGIGRITLADLETSTPGATSYRAAPAGYTLSKGSNYIEYDAGAVDNEKQMTFNDVTTPDNQDSSRGDAAAALFDATMTYLSRHCVVYTQYSLEVVGLKMALLPGDTIRVSYHGYLNDGSGKWLDVEDDLVILEAANRIDDNGIRSVGLTVATAAYWRLTDAEWMVEEKKQAKAYETNRQPVVVKDLIAPGATAGLALVTTGNGQISLRAISGGVGEGSSIVGDYLSIYGGTMIGTATLPLTTAQGTNLIESINTAASQTINWARVSKSGSSLTDLATRLHSSLQTIGANDHHNQAHVITGADHTVTGAALDIVGLSGVNTLGVLTPSADVSAGASALLRSNAGALTLATLTATTVNASTTLNIGADVQLTRSAANVLALAAGDSFQHADYAIDSDGARITDTGHGYFRYLYATELHAKSFIADLEQALAGGQIICKSVAPLASDFTAPAAGASTGLVVQDFQGFSTFRVFVDGDFVNIRSFSRPSNAQLITDGGFESLGAGGADVFASWVESAGDGAIAAEGTIKYAGSYSAKLTCGASNNTSLRQQIDVTAGQLRTLRFYARGDGTHAGMYKVYDATNSADIIATTSTGVVGTTWTLVTVPYTVPATCIAVSIRFYPGETNGYIAYFDNVTDNGNSELIIGDCWGTVEYASRDDAAKVQTYVFTRRSGTIGAGNAPGSIAATTVIAKGTLALDYGTTNNGYIESVAQSGAMASGVPYQQIVTWATDPGVTANKTVRTRIGNLNGSYGIAADYFGIGLGDYGGGNYLRYETNGGLVIQSTSGNVTMDGYGLWMDSAPAWTSSYLGLGGSAAAPTSQIMQTSSYQMQRTGIASPPSGFRKLIQADMTDVNSNWIANETLVYGSTAGGYSYWAMDFWDGSASTNVLNIRGVNGGAWDPALIYTAELRRGKNSTTYQGYIFVPLTTPLTSTSWDGDAYSDVAATTLDLSTVFSAPAGIKAVALKISARDSGSAGTRCYVAAGPASGYYAIECEVTGLANDTIRTFSGVVPCDANGDIVYAIEASGASTIDVWMTIWGYWI